MSHIKRHFLVDKIAYMGYTINTLKKGVIEMTKVEIENKINELKEQIKETMKEYKSIANGRPFYAETDNEELNALKTKHATLKSEMDNLDNLLRSGEYKIINITDEYTNLPTLIGSEKQIAWANDVREKAFTKINENIKKAIVNDEDSVIDFYRKWADDLIKNTSAKWWIEHRYEMSHI